MENTSNGNGHDGNGKLPEKVRGYGPIRGWVPELHANRKKQSKSLKARLKELLNNTNVEFEGEKMNAYQALVKQVTGKAIRGDAQFAKLVFDILKPNPRNNITVNQVQGGSDVLMALDRIRGNAFAAKEQDAALPEASGE